MMATASLRKATWFSSCNACIPSLRPMPKHLAKAGADAMTTAAPRTRGAPLAQARAAVIMLHGRGGTADDILTVAELFAQPDLAYIAPQAAGGSW